MMLATRFNERRVSSDTYTPCSGLFPSHKFQGPLATHYVVLIYGGQIIFIAGVILAVVGFTADITPMAFMGPVLGSVGLCMASAGCTVHKRSSLLRTRRIGLSHGDNYNPDSPREVYKQLAAAIFCMATLLGIIFMAIGLANDKNNGDEDLTIYFQVLGPICMGIGVIGLVCIKCADAKERRRLKQLAKEKRQKRRTTIKGHMATHTLPTDVGSLEPRQDLPQIRTISGHVNNSFTMDSEPNGNLVNLYPNDRDDTKQMFEDREPGDFSTSFLNIAAPAPPRVPTPLPPSDTDNETQFQWQNAYTFNT